MQLYWLRGLVRPLKGQKQSILKIWFMIFLRGFESVCTGVKPWSQGVIPRWFKQKIFVMKGEGTEGQTDLMVKIVM